MKELAHLNNASTGLSPALSGMNKKTVKQLSLACDQIAAETLLASAREAGRTILAQEAILNVASLEMKASHLAQIAPLARPRFAMILDAHSISAADNIMRF